MMDCREAKDRWHARYDEGRLDLELEGHLTACESCRQYAEAMQQVAEALGELRIETQGVESGAPPVGKRYEGEGHTAMGRWRIAAGLMRAAAVLLFAILAYRFVVPEAGFQSRSTVPHDDTSLVEVRGDRIPLEWAKGVEGLTLKGRSAEQFMSVAVATRQSNVKLYWLYPSMSARTGQPPENEIVPIEPLEQEPQPIHDEGVIQ